MLSYMLFEWEKNFIWTVTIIIWTDAKITWTKSIRLERRERFAGFVAHFKEYVNTIATRPFAGPT